MTNLESDNCGGGGANNRTTIDEGVDDGPLLMRLQLLMRLTMDHGTHMGTTANGDTQPSIQEVYEGPLQPLGPTTISTATTSAALYTSC